MKQMQVEIRPAVIEDAVSIAALSLELGYEMTPDDTSELIKKITPNEQNIIRVAVRDDTVIGWVQAMITTRLESGKFCEITGLIVTEQYRSKGVGHLFIKHVKNWSCKENVYKLKVGCNVKRSRTHKFYIREGFRQEKEQKIFAMGL